MQITAALATALILTFSASPATASDTLAARGTAFMGSFQDRSGAQFGSSATSGRALQSAITLEARQLQGSEAINVHGSAPAGAPVTITLLALVSPEIPTILVSRHDVVTDVNGRFGAVIPIASAYEPGMKLEILATSASGIAPARAQFTTGAPNAGASVPLVSDP